MPGTLAESLRKSLSALDLTDADQAAVRLATEYAIQLDAGADAAKLGSLYLTCLESLGMTPRARASITGKKVGTGGNGSNPLDELRKRRSTRVDATATLDSAS